MAAARQGGYVAVVFTMVIASGLFLGAAAIAVDTGRWYAEMERVQKAADAGALAGVPYLPYDIGAATSAARAAVRMNGFTHLTDRQITVEQGAVDSQLKVTVRSSVDNAFGQAFGVTSADVSRSATADYKAAAPMGSPCNTFGNEPSAGLSTITTPVSHVSPQPTGTVRNTALVNCTSNPQLWGGVQGARTDKVNGDRHQNEYCAATATATYRCTPPGNNEYREEGYFWVIQVTPEAVGQEIKLQMYDAAYINSGSNACGSLPQAKDLRDNSNSYVTTDGKKRYARPATGVPPQVASTGAPYCNGDFRPGGSDTAATDAPVTSLAVRRPTESLNPRAGSVIDECTTQFRGTATVPTATALTEKTYASSTSLTPTGNNTRYNRHLAQLLHNWYQVCSFTAHEPGDYFIQIRTNVRFGGTEDTNSNGFASMISRGNAAVHQDAGTYRRTAFLNTFSLRAWVPGYEKYVSVSGYDAMPIFANTDAAASTFHLIRVLPGAAGQFITFSFFDAADSEDGLGSVQVLAPGDATNAAGVKVPTHPAGCTSKLGDGGSLQTLTACKASVTKNNNNGNLQTITIPIPTDYTCNYKEMTGCWYKVTVALTGTSISDFTTWSATIVGDPVRLIE